MSENIDRRQTTEDRLQMTDDENGVYSYFKLTSSPKAQFTKTLYLFLLFADITRLRSVKKTTRESFLKTILHLLSGYCPSYVTSKKRVAVILFVLMFYCPVNPMGPCRARSVYLTTSQS